MFDAVCLFAFGLILLIKGGDIFVERSIDIARRLRLPDFIIGVTVLSAGTTVPEIMVSSVAAVRGRSGIAYGNILGSVICNTALVAGISILLKPCRVGRRDLVLPTLFFLLSAVMYALCAYLSGYLPRSLGIALLVLFFMFVFAQAVKICTARAEDISFSERSNTEYSLPKNIAVIIMSVAFITLGALLVNNNIEIIAGSLGISQSVAGITLVAVGTSLPELTTAISSLMKGRGSLSLGNIIGANLFNFVLVGGIAVTVSPIDVPNERLLGFINSSLALDFPVMLVCTAILTVPTLAAGRLWRVQGVLLLLIYVAFVLLRWATVG